MPQPTGEKYRNQAIFETSDKRSWIQLGMFNPTTGTADGPIGRRGEAVTYVDIEIADVKFVDVIEWNQVTDTELKVMRDQAEKDAADQCRDPSRSRGSTEDPGQSETPCLDIRNQRSHGLE